MLTTLKEILDHARANQYAVPAFDCVEDVMVRTILERAEDLRAPVILMGLPADMIGNGMAYLAGLVRAVAQTHAIPVALHLDHATELGLVRQALDCGFTSVMVDGSSLPFEQNVALTREAVDVAHAYGASVEGELGHVGGMDLDDCAIWRVGVDRTGGGGQVRRADGSGRVGRVDRHFARSVSIAARPGHRPARATACGQHCAAGSARWIGHACRADSGGGAARDL